MIELLYFYNILHFKIFLKIWFLSLEHVNDSKFNLINNIYIYINYQQMKKKIFVAIN